MQENFGENEDSFEEDEREGVNIIEKNELIEEKNASVSEEVKNVGEIINDFSGNNFIDY